MALFGSERTKKNRRKHGAEPCSTLLHCPCVLHVVVVSYASSSCPTRRRRVLHVVIVGPYTSLLGLTRCRRALISWCIPRLVGEFEARVMGSFALVSYLPWLCSKRRHCVQIAAVVFESLPMSSSCSYRPSFLSSRPSASLSSPLSSSCSSHLSPSCSSRPTTFTFTCSFCLSSSSHPCFSSSSRPPPLRPFPSFPCPVPLPPPRHFLPSLSPRRG